MVGLNAAGIHVDDLEVAPVPVTRFQVRSQRSTGGITVRLDPDDPQSVLIRFFDRNGIDIDESMQRKIERLYYREDFRRAFAADIGDIGFPPRALEYYTAALMASVDGDAIRAANFKVVLDYAYGSTSFVMPSVLAKLGADVLAVNPYAATAGAAAFDRAVAAGNLRNVVRSSGAQLGAVIDPDGEHLTLIDDSGHVLSDDEALFVLIHLVCATQNDDDGPLRIAVPVSVSRTVEEYARDHGAEIVWTKLSTSHLMEVASTEDVAFAAGQEGGFIFPPFLPAYDATATLVHLLALLARTGVRLSKIVETVPRFHIDHDVVPTPWEQKGLVMRTLVEGSDEDLVLVDGVKILRDGGWVLVLPDPTDPVTHVWAEGASDADARALVQEYCRRIRHLMR
jgi:mannose-1-phosphate guanylyltransferase/phosphomannomutase